MRLTVCPSVPWGEVQQQGQGERIPVGQPIWAPDILEGLGGVLPRRMLYLCMQEQLIMKVNDETLFPLGQMTRKRRRRRPPGWRARE